NAPRLTTAPPPTGALKAEGRRLVRDDGAELDEPARPRVNKKAAVVGGAIGLAAVVGVFGAVRFAATRHPTPEGSQATQAVRSGGDSQVSIAPGTPTADVPLFGATPLSTTEPAPGASTAPAIVAGKLEEASTANGPDGDG